MARPNKNQTRATRAGTFGHKGLVLSGDIHLIIPLDAGKHAYVIQGADTVHVPTDGTGWEAAMGKMVTLCYMDRVLVELEELAKKYPQHNWGDVLSRTKAGLASAS